MTGPAASASESEIRELASRTALACGVELVEMHYRRAGRRWFLRLDIDRPGPEGVGIDDCQKVSRALEAVLDEEDRIPGSYTLEVSSPGIERPIRSADDIRRNTGRKVTVRANDDDGRPFEVNGTLEGSAGGCLLVRSDDDGSEIRIAVDRIALAHQQLPF